VCVCLCVVSRCVFTSVAKCVLQRTHSVGAGACVRVNPCVDGAPSVKETPCVSGVVASVPECVLPSTPCVEEAPRVNETPCVNEAPCVSEQPVCVSETPRVSGMVCVRATARVSERPSMRKTACVRSLYEREMTVGMRELAAASPGVSVMARCVSLVTRRSACVEWSLSARMRWR